MSKFLICLALPAALAVAVVYEHTVHHCGSADPDDVAAGSAAAPDNSEVDGTCYFDSINTCCRPGAAASASVGQESEAADPADEPARKTDPEREVVFKAQGLICPAVKGIGCGHMLAPVLGHLDKLEGVASSAANYTGTLVRISLAAGADRAAVEAATRKALAEVAGNAVPLTGDELRRALEREQWRGADRIGELSAIEFRTLALYRIRTFAKAEKLDSSTTDKLVGIAERQWERVAKEVAGSKSNTPSEWGRRRKQALPAVLEEAKEVLSAEQVGRLKEALMTPCRGEDRPDAPAEQAKAGADR